MSKNRKRILIGAGVLVVLVGAYFVYQFFSARNTVATAAASVQTEVVEVGVLTSTVDATGTVRASQSATLSWNTSGIVESVMVEGGAVVSDGDILATLEELSLSQSVIQAAKDLYDAEQALEDLYDSYNPLALSEAEKAVADAQDAYEDAQRYYNSLTNGALQTDIDQAEADVVIMGDALAEAEEEWEKWASRPEDNVNRAYAQQEYAQAQQAYDDAVRTYNWLTSSATDTEMALAEADLALTEQQLADAQNDLEDLTSGPTGDEVRAAEAQVAAAKATLKQAWIEAPFDGIITEIIPQSGDVVTSSTEAFRIDDLSSLLIDVQVNEIDINLIEVGQEVVISFDAIRTQDFSGRVIEVGVIGDDTSGVVEFDVTIEINEADTEIKPGMTAEVGIIVSQSEEFVLVPNEAVRSEDGQQVVYILRPGEGMVPVDITLGVSSDTHSQVVAGELQEGDRIVLNPADATMAEEGDTVLRLGPGGPGSGRPNGGGGGGQP
ncbi:MAG: efflux RND transporter periplasmic adaptor subunit [Chloroflexi bacterium]|nr:efflux RND transporter periplasmic adaptor subunit [Chloroflexota bacterium]